MTPIILILYILNMEEKMSQRHWRSSLNNLNNERDLFNSLSLSGRPLSIKVFRKNPKNFSKPPWQNQKGVLYYKRRQERDRLLRVGILSPVVFLSHRYLSKGLFAHFISFLWYRVGGAPDYSKGFHGDFLSDDGERPVTAWREHIHADKAVGRLTARTDGQLILSSSVMVALKSLKL